MPYLKQHPCFKGIDWDEISKKEYKGLKELVEKYMPDEGQKFYQEEEQKRQSLCNVGGDNGVSFNPLAEENAVVLKGHLCKKNWYGAE